MLVEVQALVSPTSFGTPRRMTIGLDANRTTLLLAVLEKRVGLELLGDDVFVSVAGGLEVDGAGGGPGRWRPPSPPRSATVPSPRDTVLFGEVGLAGEVRGRRPGRACGCARPRRWDSPAASFPPETSRAIPSPESVWWASTASRRRSSGWPTGSWWRLAEGRAPPPSDRAVSSGSTKVYHGRTFPIVRAYIAVIRLLWVPGRGPKGSCMWLILFRVFLVVLLAHCGLRLQPRSRPALDGAALGVRGAPAVIGPRAAAPEPSPATTWSAR